MTLQELIKEQLLLEKPANEYSRRWNKETNLWSYQHREKLGLTPKDRDKVVHHKDGNHKNNNKKNLKAMTRAEHAAAEKPALKHKTCKICGNKHYARHLCAKHYWLYITKPKLKNKLTKQ